MAVSVSAGPQCVAERSSVPENCSERIVETVALTEGDPRTGGSDFLRCQGPGRLRLLQADRLEWAR